MANFPKPRTSFTEITHSINPTVGYSEKIILNTQICCGTSNTTFDKGSKLLTSLNAKVLIYQLKSKEYTVNYGFNE